MPMIKVDRIIVRKRLRKVDNAKVKAIAESIEDTGLINPIILNGETLIAGAHRLAAYKLLGYESIAFAHMGNVLDPESMELIEIDENLIRNELSSAERSKHAARRVEIISKRKETKEKVIAKAIKEVEEKGSKARNEYKKIHRERNGQVDRSVQESKTIIKEAEALM